MSSLSTRTDKRVESLVLSKLSEISEQGAELFDAFTRAWVAAKQRQNRRPSNDKKRTVARFVVHAPSRRQLPITPSLHKGMPKTQTDLTHIALHLKKSYRSRLIRRWPLSLGARPIEPSALGPVALLKSSEAGQNLGNLARGYCNSYPNIARIWRLPLFYRGWP